MGNRSKYQSDRSRGYGGNLCEGCLEKQREIDRLREEVQRLKARLNQRDRKQAEVQLFAAAVIPLLADAIHLHSKPLSDEQYYREARKIKGQIERTMKAEARHLGIRRIQDLFVEKAERVYQ